MPQCRTNQYYNSFIPTMVRNWNGLSDNIKHIADKADFVIALRETIPVENPLYSLGTRIEAIRHTQMRVGFSPLNSHLYRHGLAENERCPCGYEVEDIKHFFIDCPLYVHQRRDLINTLVQFNLNVSVDILLAGSDLLTFQQNKLLFQAVQNISKRFP